MLTRRSLVQTTVFASFAAVLSRASSWAADAAQPAPAPVPGPFKLPPLPYENGALEPHIDAKTMQIHHDKHHGGYVNNLNKAVADFPDVAKRSLEDLCSNWETLPEAIKTAVRNNAGGHFNHSLFWQMLSPKGGGEPSGDLAKAIDTTFGSFDMFKDRFTKEAMAVFGSGWAWLVADKNKLLSVVRTPNQDTVLPLGFTPLLGVDVWEHAYYLKHQNLRSDYLGDFWKVVDWSFVGAAHAKAVKG
jgi:Fe-Mn family superoxide dismutase